MDIKVIACVVLVLVSMSEGAGGQSWASASSSANAGAGPFGGFGPFSSPFINGRFGGNDISGFPYLGSNNDWLEKVQRQNKEWLDKVQAQNAAFNRQAGNNQAPGAWAIGSASITDSAPLRPDTRVFTRTHVTYPLVMGTPFPGGYTSLPQFPSRFNNNGLDGGFSSGSGSSSSSSSSSDGSFGGNSGSNSGGAWASGSASSGPQGNYQSGAFGPANPDITSRFSEGSPSSGGGNSHSSFSSSSSSSRRGPDGKLISHKEVITGTNDNGKKSVHAIRD